LIDLRYALKGLLKQPGFAAVVILTLALGIGGATTIFGVVNTVLLRPLPYPHSDRLQVIWGNFRRLNIERLPAKAAEFEDYARQTTVFDGVAAYVNHSFNVSATGAEPERVTGAYVSSNLFALLETAPVAGRGFTAADSRVVVLSYGYWQRRFGGSTEILNRQVLLDNESYTVVGVMPEAFQFPHPSFRASEPADLWTLLSYSSDDVVNRRGPYYLTVLGRLAPGVGVAQARSHMDALGAQFERELRGYRGPNGEDGGWRISVVPLQEEIVGKSRNALLVLLVSVGILLLIASANVANLLLMRTTKRRRELAIRAALGANRWRLARQLLFEGLLLTTFAAALGLLFASWGIDLLGALGPNVLPRAQELTIDVRVFAFTAVVALAISVAFGLVPLRTVAGIDLRESLSRAGQFGSTGGPGRLLDVLVIAEVSLAVLLLVGSGLLAKSLLNLQRVDPGLVTENLLSVELDLAASAYRDENAASDFFRELVQRVEAQPGVHAVSFSTQQPLNSGAGNDPFAIEGRKLDPANLTTAAWQVVGPNYLQTLGIPIAKGRDLTEQDLAPGAPPVAVINEKMAARFWPSEDPVGKRITLGLPRPENPWVTIVGVAKNTPHRTLDSQAEPDWYVSRTLAAQRHRFLFVRSVLPVSSVAAAVRKEVAAIDPQQPLSSVKTMNEVVAATTAPRRFNTIVLALFAGLALILATVGIYSVISYATALRTREFAIRSALGAARGAVLLLVVRQGMTLALIGSALGFIAALGLTRLMSSLLFGVSPSDPFVYLLVAAGCLVAALLACLVPARRATEVDPLIALRYE
jgi:putative ABC transport system permease protein